VTHITNEKKENEQAQSENPTKPPPPNRVFSLLGGFFCCYGWFRLSLSLASSSFPEPLWDCDKGGSASEKNR